MTLTFLHILTSKMHRNLKCGVKSPMPYLLPQEKKKYKNMDISLKTLPPPGYRILK